MLRAVPATIFIADSIVNAFRSGILFSAIALTWSQLTLPTLLRFGSGEPPFTFAASTSCTAAGAVFWMNSNDLSEYTVMITGTTLPARSLVRALNCLQNSMMLTPFAPSAGPIDGAGFAAPPLICRLITAVMSFALFFEDYVLSIMY